MEVIAANRGYVDFTVNQAKAVFQLTDVSTGLQQLLRFLPLTGIRRFLPPANKLPSASTGNMLYIKAVQLNDHMHQHKKFAMHSYWIERFPMRLDNESC